MCDYSLESVASRPAKVGDMLVSSLFSNSGTRGFAAVGEPEVAVCLLPGTELAFEKPVEFEARFGFLTTRRINQTMARFRHINENVPRLHHDALEFADGKIILLTHLRQGQVAHVLQLPAHPHAVEPAPEETAARSVVD
ncbi:MAG: hypothetical protein K0R27_4551 [Xanthobacteraceae bacterium]|jgi:hypothetical protein|nr:hypothetical protein [Xanthobacteraceae bacterium]